MELTQGEILSAAGVLLGFQVASFTWRVSREVAVAKTDITWLPVADILNLLSMLVVVFGVFVLPILNVVKLSFMNRAFGLALILFIGFPFALAGHYEMFNKSTQRSMQYFPLQEKIVSVVVILAVIAYLTVLLR